jgi:hypothetical protein
LRFGHADYYFVQWEASLQREGTYFRFIPLQSFPELAPDRTSGHAVRNIGTIYKLEPLK